MRKPRVFCVVLSVDSKHAERFVPEGDGWRFLTDEYNHAAFSAEFGSKRLKGFVAKNALRVKEVSHWTIVLETSKKQPQLEAFVGPIVRWKAGATRLKRMKEIASWLVQAPSGKR
jgi:hypothetical protein